jgi:hypothetical protein
LQQARKRGVTADCRSASDAINTLALEKNRAAEAFALWKVTCAKPQHAGYVSDGSFAVSEPEVLTPFDWTLPGSGGVSAQIVDGALRVRNSNSLPDVVASQLVLLPSGPTVLRWTATATGDAAALSGAVSLRCPNGQDLSLGQARRARTGDTGYSIVLIVPQGCTPQKLTASISSETGDTTFDDISAAPVGGGPTGGTASP